MSRKKTVSRLIRRFVNCADPMCAAYTLTTNEFMLLRGEQWTQSFRTTLGKAAGKLYEQLYGKKRSRRVRTHLMAQTARNKVRTYPCGILEQAYQALTESQNGSTTALPSENPIAAAV